MANANDSEIIEKMLSAHPRFMAEFFSQNSKHIIDDSTYWSVLGTLWKGGGTVVQQDLWIRLFNSPRRQKHKIMKKRERKAWRNLPCRVVAYRAINDISEIDEAISWSLSESIAERIFSEKGERLVVSNLFSRRDIFAYFDRRHEDEILVHRTGK